MTFFELKNPRIMIFIDGGHVREELKKAYGSDDFDIHKLSEFCINHFIKGDKILQRIYYFDGEVLDKGNPRYFADKPYLDNIRKQSYVEVIPGDLIHTPSGWRQKGVDLLLAINMVSKAFLNHYDCGILISADRDYKAVIKMIKNHTSKRLYGASLFKEINQDVKDEYDDTIMIDDPKKYGIA